MAFSSNRNKRALFRAPIYEVTTGTLPAGLSVLDGQKFCAIPPQGNVLNSITTFVTTKAVDHHGGLEPLLLTRFDVMNAQLFDGSLPPIHIKIGSCPSGAICGQYRPVGDHGFRGEIIINERIVTGKSKMFPHSSWCSGVNRILGDALLHQMAHAAVDLLDGAHPEGSQSHGYHFTERCRQLNKRMRIQGSKSSPFASKDGLQQVESGTWWPFNVRGVDYYNGSWIPPRKILRPKFKPQDLDSFALNTCVQSVAALHGTLGVLRASTQHIMGNLNALIAGR